MTQEEKAKAYDEALKKLHEIITMDNHPVLPKEIGEFLFPQLAESEDERIRKDIIRFFRDASRSNTMVINSESFAEWADYLEKQKEYKSIEDAAKEATKDRESAEKFLKTAGIVDENGNLAEIYRSEQGPVEWSEENDVNLGDIKCALYDYYGEERAEELYNMVKSLCSQPHTVSIKDATKFDNLEYERGVKDGIQDSENHRWKPSAEQMKVLDVAIAAALDNQSSNLASGLITLRKDLEKL